MHLTRSVSSQAVRAWDARGGAERRVQATVAPGTHPARRGTCRVGVEALGTGLGRQGRVRTVEALGTGQAERSVGEVAQRARRGLSVGGGA